MVKGKPDNRCAVDQFNDHLGPSNGAGRAVQTDCRPGVCSPPGNQRILCKYLKSKELVPATDKNRTIQGTIAG